MNWVEVEKYENEQKIRMAGNHLVLVPARNEDAPLDTVDVFDGERGEFIATQVPEKPAREFVVIWNELLDSGESIEKIRTINLEWLTGISGKKVYG